MTAQRDPDDLYDESVEPTRFELRATECNRELAKEIREVLRCSALPELWGEPLRAALKKWELSL